MQRSMQLSLAVLACAALMSSACSDESGTVDPVVKVAGQQGTTGTAGGTDTSGTPTTPPPPTSNGPVVSVQITPKQVVLPLGYYATLAAIGLDANGVRVANQRAAWRSSDVNVAVASDTGIVYGKALGTAKIYGTIAGHTDSATVTVVAAQPVPTPPAPQPAVASFDMTATVVGAIPGTDTSRTERVAGVVVKLTRIGGVSGDTLAVSVDAGSAVSDANGVVSFKRLAGGAYTIEATPPAGSPYAATRTGIGPPRDATITTTIRLGRKP